jgi:valyl-tRNA synthetase
MNEGTTQQATAARQTLVYVLERALRLLHPYMPFLTEELWQQLPVTGESVMIADWPKTDATQVDREAVQEFDFLMNVVRSIRNARAESNVEPKLWIAALVFPGSHSETFTAGEGVFKFLARVDGDHLTYQGVRAEPSEQSISLVVDDAVIYLPLAGMVDIAAERERLTKEINEVSEEIKRASDLLGNENFVSRAPEHVVSKHRERLADANERKELLEERLNSLGA